MLFESSFFLNYLLFKRAVVYSSSLYHMLDSHVGIWFAVGLLSSMCVCVLVPLLLCLACSEQLTMLSSEA